MPRQRSLDLEVQKEYENLERIAEFRGGSVGAIDRCHATIVR